VQTLSTVIEILAALFILALCAIPVVELVSRIRHEWHGWCKHWEAYRFWHRFWRRAHKGRAGI
jgi:ABC-type Fe3+ transport system permease subunit